MTRLENVCDYVTDKVTVGENDAETYISTENMLPNRGGVIASSTLPVGQKGTAYCHGDVLVSNIRPYFKKIWQAPHSGICSNDVLVFRAKRECDESFLYHLLSSDDFFAYDTKTAKGTKMPRGDKRALMQYEFNLPSLLDQQRIGIMLNGINAQIDNLNRTNRHLLELARALFLREVVLGGDSWEEGSLLDIADYRNGLAMQKFRPTGPDAGLPVLKIRELREGRCGTDSERCKSDIDESVKVSDGDIIFSWSGSLLVDLWAGGDAGLNQHLFKVTSKRYPKWFYYLWTDYHLPRFVSMAADRATTMGHIKRSALENATVAIPPKSDLEELDGVFGPMVDLIVTGKVEVRRLEQLRDTLLPMLMSGEIDVSKVELLVE